MAVGRKINSGSQSVLALKAEPAKVTESISSELEKTAELAAQEDQTKQQPDA